MTSFGATPEARRLEALQEEFERDASCNQVFLVLTVGATLIATLGLLANSPGVVIGAMVVAPWIMPLQAMAFEIAHGRLAMVGRALRTLLVGVAICVLLAMAVGHLVAFPSFGSEVMNRTSPNLLDLGIALVAGAVAMFAKLRKDALSALAGLAIAVALMPPICVVGILLASAYWGQAYGALLLFTTNLLGILVGAMATLAALEPLYRSRLLRSKLGLTSLGLTTLLLIPLGGSFVRLLGQANRENKAALHSRLRPGLAPRSDGGCRQCAGRGHLRSCNGTPWFGAGGVAGWRPPLERATAGGLAGHGPAAPSWRIVCR